MSTSLDAWIEGTYEAMVRPKPKHRLVSAWVRCSAPVTFAVATSEEARIAVQTVETDFFGKERRTVVRNHRGRLYSPYGSRSVLSEFLEDEANGSDRSHFRQGRNAKTPAELKSEGAVVLTDKRNGFGARMHELASRILIVDGVVHVETMEPILSLKMEDEGPRLSLADAGSSGAEAVHRLDAMSTMMRTIEIVMADDPGARLRNDIVSIDIGDMMPRFDERHCTATQLALLGKSMMSKHDMHMLDDDAIQAILDMRRVGSMPVEHVEERYDASIDAAARFMDFYSRLRPEVAHEWRYYARHAKMCVAADRSRGLAAAADLDGLSLTP